MNAFFNRVLQSTNLAFAVVMVLSGGPTVVSLFISTNTNEMAATTGYMLLVYAMCFCTWLSAVVMALVTLKHGPKRGLALLPILCVPGVVATYYTHSVGVFITTVVLKYGFVWLLAAILYVSVSWSLVIETACLLGFFTVIAFHLSVAEPTQFWLTYLNLDQIPDKAVVQFLTSLLPFFTGIVALVICVEAMTVLLAARGIQARLFNPGGLRRELSQVQCSIVTVLCVGLTGIAAFFGRAFALDAMIIVIWPLVFAGLVAVHYYAARLQRPWFLLVPMYLVGMFNPKCFGIGLCMIATFSVLLRWFMQDQKAHTDAVV